MNSIIEPMEKHFISANELLADSFKLAERILQSGFKPDLIVGVWRGGAPVGVAVQEWLNYRGVETDHISIRTSSYKDLDQQEPEVRVYSLDYITDNYRRQHKILLVDDVFDTGRSMRAIIKRLKDLTGDNCPQDIRIAAPWFKPTRNKTDIIPDYYEHEVSQWLVFPHEMKGLSPQEIIAGKPELGEALRPLLPQYTQSEIKK